jgi:hypothetical protein
MRQKLATSHLPLVTVIRNPAAWCKPPGMLTLLKWVLPAVAGAVTPLSNDVTRSGNVTLFVESDPAEHGVQPVFPQGLDHRGREGIEQGGPRALPRSPLPCRFACYLFGVYERRAPSLKM